MRRRTVLAGLSVLAAAYAGQRLLRRTTPLEHFRGEWIYLAPDAPVQEKLPADAAAFRHEGDLLAPVALFSLKALVLSRCNYRRGREAVLSPTDLALGWGPMSSPAIVEDVPVSQSGRWYRFRAGPSAPLAVRDISLHSSNMHIIPADPAVRDQLDDVRQGDVVRIRGMLVDARGDDGFFWNSSRSRTDTGDGACEIVFAESLRINA